jgi:cardiolipin synthase
VAVLQLRQIPNTICILRILMIGPIVWALITGEHRLALGLIVVAGLSDGLDGFLAKRFGWQTWLGGILDPFADKLLMLSTFLALAWSGLAPVWLTAVVITRDIVIVAGALAYHYLIDQVEPEPTRISKLNTGLQLLFIVFVLSAQAYAWPPEISILVIGASVFVASAVSGLDYVLRYAAQAGMARTA